MNARRLKSTALLALALALLPGVGAAQEPDVNATLYEVTETMKVRLHPAGGRRVATAALMGWVSAGTPLCPAELAGGAARCTVIAFATDNINLATGRGPVRGSFAVVVQGDNPVDAPELVVIRGEISGTIDLSPLLGTPPSPLGFVTGRWSAHGVGGTPLAGFRGHGRLSGTFRLPFVINGSVPLYLTDGGPVPVAPEEYSLGLPTVKLELRLE